MTQKNVLIVGGGIAGITLAYFLQKKYKVTIIEKASGWRTIGYGVGIWKSGIDILRKMPLSQDFWSSAWPVNKGATIGSKGQILLEMPFDTQLKDEPITYAFERDLLHKAIHSLLDTTEVKFNTTFDNIQNSEQYDLIVGADGVRSKVREKFFGNASKSYHWNLVGFWIPKELGVFDGYCIFGGEKETLLCFPYHDRHSIGLMYKTDIDECPKKLSHSEILEKFPLLRDKVKDIVLSVEDIQSIYSDRLDYAENKTWYEGNVVLIGDAKHGMSPLTGIGTSMALEDAFVLAEELDQGESVSSALRKFALRRDRRFKSVNIFRWIIENIGMPNSKTAEIIRDILVKIMPLSFPNFIFKWVFTAKI
jgi:2-polyprenyl-6-methoxyphenol hydroxylase-like FAD-dependent oxidoreductase